MLSDNGPHFASKLSAAITRLLGAHRIFTSSYHPSTNGGTERVNHTMAQILATVTNERQTDWDLHLPLVQMNYNNSVHVATGLAPNEVHIGRMSRLPLTVFDREPPGGHQSLDRDIAEYHISVSNRLRLTYEVVREENLVNAAKVAKANSVLDDICLLYTSPSPRDRG